MDFPEELRVLVAQDAEEFAQRMLDLAGDPAAWQRVSDAALKFVAERFSAQAIDLKMRETIAEVRRKDKTGDLAPTPKKRDKATKSPVAAAPATKAAESPAIVEAAQIVAAPEVVEAPEVAAAAPTGSEKPASGLAADPIVPASVAETLVAEAVAAETAVAEAPIAEAVVAEAAVVEAPVAEEPVAGEAPVIESQAAEAPLAAAPPQTPPSMETPAVGAEPAKDGSEPAASLVPAASA
jgi:hypothetical protein